MYTLQFYQTRRGYVYMYNYTILSETDSHIRLGSCQLPLCKFKNWKSEFLLIPVKFEKRYMYFLNRVDVLDTWIEDLKNEF